MIYLFLFSCEHIWTLFIDFDTDDLENQHLETVKNFLYQE